ncbi:MAG: aspartyl protease family protein [Magnetococcales bacterium]|nr:aspartyl protease family protein [Magnetococcales bacterium]
MIGIRHGRGKRAMLLALALLITPWPRLTAEEMVQCSDGKGDPQLFRRQECQPLKDPTVPRGKPTADASAGERGADQPVGAPEVGLLPESGSVGDNPEQAQNSKPKVVTRIPGPWHVTEILVPAKGEADQGYAPSAIINGQRRLVGDTVDGGVVGKIHRDRVVIRHEGRETVVPFDRTTHAAPPGRVGVVPLKRHPSGVYLLKLRINDNPEFEAVLDTGASDLALPPEVVTWLVRTGSLRKEHLLGKGKARLADGSEHDTRYLLLSKLRIGDMELKGVPVIEIPKKQDKSDGAGDKEDKGGQIGPGSGEADKKNKEEKIDPEALLQPLFGIKPLERLGRWRIDHGAGQLIVER